MKIVLTGGGTGGHFYPLIAVADAIHEVALEEKLLEPTLYYLGPNKYDERALFDAKVQFKSINATKLGKKFSPRRIISLMKIGVGVLESLVFLFKEYPDVVFSKGGYASFPVVMAAHILRIPVIIHESDTIPGKVNKWSAKFAEKIAISYPDAAEHFPKEKTALTGNPIRKQILKSSTADPFEYMNLDPSIPVILVLGGSQGAETINQLVTSMLPRVLDKYQVVHQTGPNNIEVVKSTTTSILRENPYKERYKAYASFNAAALGIAASTASLVISRAGSTLFEIAAWGLPSIIIPIPTDVSHDQERNAFSYGRSGAGTVIVQSNLNDDILYAEIERIMTNDELRKSMIEATKKKAYPDAALKIAKALIQIGLKHEE